MAASTYSERCENAERQILRAIKEHSPLGLKKATSNLFRSRREARKALLDLHDFNHILNIDSRSRTADVEGMTTYEALVNATLQQHLLPAVVPELKTITVGGAVSGLGIESSSFHYGLVHETIEAMDVLLGSGHVVSCSRTKDQDLFFGIPNSYGTLGYVLRLQVRLVPAPPAIHLQHRRFCRFEDYFRCVSELVDDRSLGYLDGTMFSPSELYITSGQACAATTALSDYSGMQPYYASIRQRTDDWLSAAAYIWRWDTDWFWCSRQFHLDKPLLRFLFLPTLGSRNYQRAMRLSRRLLPKTEATESVIQDVQIPIDRAAEFASFLFTDLRIAPIWICPFRSFAQSRRFDLCPFEPDALYVNFGFWDVLPARGSPGALNRLVERKARDLGGLKALYSSSYYDEESFWTIYNKSRYDQLRSTYSAAVFPDLFLKCVLRM